MHVVLMLCVKSRDWEYLSMYFRSAREGSSDFPTASWEILPHFLPDYVRGCQDTERYTANG